MSSFGGVEFIATSEGFNDKGGALEEITVGLLIENASAWGALFAMRSWAVTQRPIPGGNNVIVDIAGGAGVFGLSIDNLDGHQAILITLTRDELEPGSLRSKGTATFLVTS